MTFHTKKIGVWGLGIVGKATIRFFHSQNISVDVMEKRDISEEEQIFLTDNHATLYKQTNVIEFLSSHDLCIASPGIDLRPYSHYSDRFITELDIFYYVWKKPIIAITGSVGKTTTTHLLSQLLESSMRIATGGNIGIGMLDLLAQQESCDAALLELSSFQLEQCKEFAPSLALWTNFHENHLDRHATAADYFKAKANIFSHQKNTDTAIVPLALYKNIRSLFPDRSFIWHSATPPATEFELQNNDSIYYLEHDTIVLRKNSSKRTICSIDLLPKLSFLENWITIVASLDTLQIPLIPLLQRTHSLQVPEHRLEKVATIKGVTFYNDSKSTIPMATMAALNNFPQKPIILFVGGVSKGVDRSPFIKSLADKVKLLYCFGKEARELCDIALSSNIASFSYDRLEDALVSCIQTMQDGDVVLFSPAGASYDLFKNYEERGDRFKLLVTNSAKQLTRNH